MGEGMKETNSHKENWDALKEHCKVQMDRYSMLKSGINKIGVHIWRDVLNKMWSLENKNNDKNT